MRRITGVLLRIYPASWRERYGGELEALAADAPEGWRTDLDVLKGAVGMRMRLQGAWALLALFLAAGALLGWLSSYLMTPQWEAAAVIMVTPAVIPEGATDNSAANEYILKLANRVTARTSLAAIVNDPHIQLYARERMTQPLEDVLDRMRRDIRVMIMAQTKKKLPNSVFRLRFRYSDPAKTVATVNALIALYKQASAETTGYYVDVLDVPVLPRMPIFPSRAAFAVAGLTTGLVLALKLLVRRLIPRQPVPQALPPGASACALRLV
jgi:hypothetical protein